MDTNKAKSYFWVLLDVLIVGLVVNLVFFVMPTIGRFGASLAPVRTITVSAEGKAIVIPDIALSSFSVVSRGPNPEVIADSNNKKISAVIDFLKSQGMDAKDMQTTGYNLSPEYRYDQDTGRSSITGYTLTQTVNVKMRDFKKIPQVLAGLTPLGINQIGGLSFTVEDPDKYLGIARAEAIQKAQLKAREMAGQSGASLGRVVSVGEYNTRPIPYGRFDAMAMGAVESRAPVALPTIEPGTEEVRNQVTITYELK